MREGTSTDFLFRPSPSPLSLLSNKSGEGPALGNGTAEEEKKPYRYWQTETLLST